MMVGRDGLSKSDCLIDTERLACDAAYRDASNSGLIESLGPNAFADQNPAQSGPGTTFKIRLDLCCEESGSADARLP